MAAFGLRPGPQLGAVLRELSEAQAAGEIRTREAALAYAAQVLAAPPPEA